MYEALEDVSDTLKALPKGKTTQVLNMKNFEELCAALSETAKKLDQAARSSTSSEDSANLSKLYQGAIAAKRIIENLYERAGRTAMHVSAQVTPTLAYKNPAY